MRSEGNREDVEDERNRRVESSSSGCFGSVEVGVVDKCEYDGVGVRVEE